MYRKYMKNTKTLRRKLDLSSLALMLVGIPCLALGTWIAAERQYSALVIAPAVAAITIGATNLTKKSVK